MNKLDEMWAALAVYQPKANAEGHGDTWATMCREKTSEAAAYAAYVAYASAEAADAARAAWSAAAVAYAKATASAETAVAAKAAGDADWWAQSAIDGINKLKE
jgi:hypothetical protein